MAVAGEGKGLGRRKARQGPEEVKEEEEEG